MMDIILYISGFTNQSFHSLNKETKSQLKLYESSQEWYQKYINHLRINNVEYMALESNYTNNYNWKKEYMRIIKYEHLHLFVGQQYVTELFLCGCNIKVIPPEIKFFINLTSLNLSSNCIKKVPPEIAYLNNLNNLKLNRNQINIFPLEITRLQKLELVDFCLNQINTIPQEITQLQKLVSIDLSYNYIKIVQPELHNLIIYRKMLLYYNPLDNLANKIKKMIKSTQDFYYAGYAT